MKPWFLIAAAATLIGMAPLPQALAGNDTEFLAAKAFFDAARAGDGSKAEVAADRFSALLEREPTNPLFAAYHASAVVMQARDAWMPWTKMKRLEDGLADMDRALQMLTPQHESEAVNGLPVAMTTRLVAANAFIAVPSFANRGAEGRRLVRGLISSEAFAHAPAPFRISALELAIASSTDTEAGRAAWQQQLAELRQTHTVASGARR